VRQVAPELIAELDEPWGRLRELLAAANGELEVYRRNSWLRSAGTAKKGCGQRSRRR